MRRVQLQLTDDQLVAVESEASATGHSLAATLRAIVDEWVTRRDRALKWDRALAAVGGFHSGLHDVSARHDEYLDEEPE